MRVGINYLLRRRNRTASYSFGAVRVATLTLLILTALSACRSCGVVTAKIFRPSRYLAQLTDGLGRHFDVWVHLDPHLIWQATKCQLKRGNALYCIRFDAYSLSTLFGTSRLEQPTLPSCFAPPTGAMRGLFP